MTLVRSLLEYSCTVLDPHQEQNIQKLEGIQRKAARFVQNDYRQQSSVSSMMKELGWRPLHKRRREQRLVMLFKILHSLVAISPIDHHLALNERPSRKHSKQLRIITANSDSYKFSFFPRTIKDWNNLGDSEVSCQAIDQFKAAMQKTI